MGIERLLILNAGSSSLKFTVYGHVSAGGTGVEASGQIEGIGSTSRLVARDGAGQRVADESPATAIRDCGDALVAVAQWLRSRLGDVRLRGVGHRVVHGGAHYQTATLVTPQVLADLHKFVPLAPLHQPHNLATIEAVGERLPGVPQVACFDTAFHRSLPPVAQLVPLPEEIRAEGVQRYGFHGLSYEYIASALPHVAPAVADGRVVVAHLGSGASLCALQRRRSVDTTLGFTALDGLCMGTRPGAIDPGVILYLFQNLKLSPRDVETLLYKRSGLLGISGTSNDMRKLLASDEPAARLAVDYFVYRAVREIGALAATMGGIDALVFTAGIGEKSPEIRRRICAGCAWLGVTLDEAANQQGRQCISTTDSRTSVWSIPTNEEIMIARHTVALLGPSG